MLVGGRWVWTNWFAARCSRWPHKGEGRISYQIFIAGDKQNLIHSHDVSQQNYDLDRVAHEWQWIKYTSLLHFTSIGNGSEKLWDEKSVARLFYCHWLRGVCGGSGSTPGFHKLIAWSAETRFCGVYTFEIRFCSKIMLFSVVISAEPWLPPPVVAWLHNLTFRCRVPCTNFADLMRHVSSAFTAAVLQTCTFSRRGGGDTPRTPSPLLPNVYAKIFPSHAKWKRNNFHLNVSLSIRKGFRISVIESFFENKKKGERERQAKQPETFQITFVQGRHPRKG